MKKEPHPASPACPGQLLVHRAGWFLQSPPFLREHLASFCGARSAFHPRFFYNSFAIFPTCECPALTLFANINFGEYQRRIILCVFNLWLCRCPSFVGKSQLADLEALGCHTKYSTWGRKRSHGSWFPSFPLPEGIIWDGTPVKRSQRWQLEAHE